MNFLLLNGQEDVFFKNFLEEVAKPLGSLIVSDVAEGVPSDIEEPDGLIIIDATVVDSAEQLTARLLSENPARRIVVITASPTWKRARAVLEAGAMDYLPKTLTTDEMRKAFRRALRTPLLG